MSKKDITGYLMIILLITYFILVAFTSSRIRYIVLDVGIICFALNSFYIYSNSRKLNQMVIEMACCVVIIAITTLEYFKILNPQIALINLMFLAVAGYSRYILMKGTNKQKTK